MKKFMNILSLLMLAVVAFAMTACSSTEDKLIEEVDQFNKETPINCGDGVVIEKASLNKTDKMIVFDIACSEEGYTVSDFEAEKDEMKAIFLQGMTQSKNNALNMGIIAEAGYGFEYKLKGVKSGEVLPIKITSEELAKAAK